MFQFLFPPAVYVCTHFLQPYCHFMFSDLNFFLPVFSNILLFYFVCHWLLVSLLIFLFLNICVFSHFCICLFSYRFLSVFWICLPFYSSCLSTQKHVVLFPTWKKSLFNTMAFQYCPIFLLSILERNPLRVASACCIIFLICFLSLAHSSQAFVCTTLLKYVLSRPPSVFILPNLVVSFQFSFSSCSQ